MTLFAGDNTVMGPWYKDLIIILNNHHSNDSCLKRLQTLKLPTVKASSKWQEDSKSLFNLQECREISRYHQQPTAHQAHHPGLWEVLRISQKTTVFLPRSCHRHRSPSRLSV